MARRVRRPTDTEEVVELLSQEGREPGPFPRIVDILVFAASLGFQRQKREPFEPLRGKEIRFELFKEAHYEDIVNMMALAVYKDPVILGDDDENFEKRIAVFEEFANGGLKIIKREIVDKGMDILDGIIGLIQQGRSPEKDAEPMDLRGLVAEL